MGAFSYHRFIFLLPCIDLWIVYNRLLSACIVKTAIEIKHMFQLAKTALLSGFFVSLRLFVRVINRGDLAFRTTIIEDTHLTLAAIPFKVEAKNTLIFLPLQIYEKKFDEFPFLYTLQLLVIKQTADE